MANRLQIEQAINLINAQAKEQITVSDSATGLTSAVYGTCTRAIMQIQEASIRFWTTGDNPTTTEGFSLSSGSFLELHGKTELENFKAIRDDSDDAVLAISYFK